MCLAIYKPGGKDVPEDYLKNGFVDNPNGAGIAYPEDGKLVIHKGWFRFDPFFETYKKVKDRPLLIHFRMRTHGDQSEENCHPFRIDDNHAMIHNGIIQISTKHEDYKNASDSRIFTDLILRPIFTKDPEFAWTPHGRFLIEQAIGYNKIAIMDATGKALILNEEKGNEKDGIWYSNKGYLPTKRYTFPAATSVGRDQQWTGHGDWSGSDYEAPSNPKGGDTTKGRGGGRVETIHLQRTADGEGWEPTTTRTWLGALVEFGTAARFGFTARDLAVILAEYPEA